MSKQILDRREREAALRRIWRDAAAQAKVARLKVYARVWHEYAAANPRGSTEAFVRRFDSLWEPRP